jgi:hypothetical protein
MKTLIIEVDAGAPHSVLLDVQIAGTLDRVSRVADKILMNRSGPSGCRVVRSSRQIPERGWGFGHLRRSGRAGNADRRSVRG